MGDLAVRGALFGVGVFVVVATAIVARRMERRRAVRTPLDLASIEESVVFFTDRACLRCGLVRDRLIDGRIPHREVDSESHPELFGRGAVEGVPLLVFRDPAGFEVARIAGVPSERRLRRVAARVGPIHSE